MSIVSGGFEPRPGSERFFSSSVTGEARPFVHAYRRDNEENYLFVVLDGQLRVFNSEGTVVYNLSLPYFETPEPMADIRAVTAGDTTILVNRRVTVSYTDAQKPVGEDSALITCVKGDNTYGSWYLRVDIGSSTYTASASDLADTTSVISTLKNGLGIPPEKASVTLSGSTLIIRNETNEPMNVSHRDFWGDQSLVVIHKETPSTSDLPLIAENGMMVAIGSDPETQVWMQFQATGASEGMRMIGRGQWVETVAPDSKYALDATTLPRAFKNTAVDSFAYESIAWGSRNFGFDGDIFEPAFIGKGIEDVTFHRDRLVVLSGEHVDCSAQGDYFNFFPERSTEVLDTDPFSRTASSRNVNYLYHAVPFRSQLFIMSENGQFELRGDPVLTPKTATLELATQYQAEPRCAPVVMGSELYFPATIDSNVTALFEYYFQEASVSHTATNATIQVEDYVPGPAVKMVADSVTNTLFLLQEQEQNAVYVYKTFWDGTEKRQSSWSKWVFGHDIKNITIFRDRLLLITIEDGQLVTYQVPLSNASPLLSKASSKYHLDAALKSTNITKDMENGITYAEFSQNLTPSSEVYCVLAAGEDSLVVLGMVQADGVTVLIPHVSEAEYEVYAGEPFESSVTLSKLFPKDPEGRAIQHGRTQLKRLSIDYEDSSYFNVEWEAPGRTKKRSPMDSRESSDALNVNLFPELVDGVHNVKLRGSSDQLRIKIGSNQPYPYKITGLRWKGTYHDKYGG